MEKIGLLFQPGAREVASASNPCPEGNSRSQMFHRILPARASSPVDLVVDVNSQDATQASCRANVPRKGRHHHRAPCSKGPKS